MVTEVLDLRRLLVTRFLGNCGPSGRGFPLTPAVPSLSYTLDEGCVWSDSSSSHNDTTRLFSHSRDIGLFASTSNSIVQSASLAPFSCLSRVSSRTRAASHLSSTLLEESRPKRNVDQRSERDAADGLEGIGDRLASGLDVSLGIRGCIVT